MAKKKKAKEIEQILAAQTRKDGIYLVHTTYWESDAMNAVGQVLKNDWDRGDSSYTSVLNTNDSLAPIWCSPEGNLWVASGRGNIYTTAQVNFPEPRPGLDYEGSEDGPAWSVTTLPDMKGKGFRPNVTALWGTSDNQVFAGTFSGGIYYWDGKQWSQQYSDVEDAIHHIHGSAEDDVYAVGHQGLILHFDGTGWRRVPYPDDDWDGRVLTGVRAVSRTEALITGRDGRILHGNRNGIEVLGEWPSEFYGVGLFNKRYFLSAGEDGIQELKGNKTTVLKDNFATVGVFESDRKIFFTEPDQDPACIVEFDPKAEPPWWRRTF